MKKIKHNWGEIRSAYGDAFKRTNGPKVNAEEITPEIEKVAPMPALANDTVSESAPSLEKLVTEPKEIRPYSASYPDDPFEIQNFGPEPNATSKPEPVVNTTKEVKPDTIKATPVVNTTKEEKLPEPVANNKLETEPKVGKIDPASFNALDPEDPFQPQNFIPKGDVKPADLLEKTKTAINKAAQPKTSKSQDPASFVEEFISGLNNIIPQDALRVLPPNIGRGVSRSQSVNPEKDAEDRRIKSNWEAVKYFNDLSEMTVNQFKRERDPVKKEQIVRNFFSAFGERVSKSDIWSLGASELGMQEAALVLANKIEKEGTENLRPDEKALIDALAISDYVASGMGRMIGTESKVANSIAESIPFMVTIALSGGGKTVASQALKRVVQKKLTNMLAKKGISRVAGKAMIGIEDMALRAATTSLVQPTTYSKILEKNRGQWNPEQKRFGITDPETDEFSRPNVADAIYKGYMSNTVENAAELSGYYLFKPIGNFARNLGMQGLQKALPKINWGNVTKMATKFDGFAAKFGYNGFIEEWLEEQIAIPMHAATTGENELSDLVNPQVQKEIALSIGIMSGVFTGINAVGSGIHKRKIVRDYEKAEADLKKMYSESFGPKREGEEHGLQDVMEMAANNSPHEFNRWLQESRKQQIDEVFEGTNADADLFQIDKDHQDQLQQIDEWYSKSSQTVGSDKTAQERLAAEKDSRIEEANKQYEDRKNEFKSAYEQLISQIDEGDKKRDAAYRYYYALQRMAGYEAGLRGRINNVFEEKLSAYEPLRNQETGEYMEFTHMQSGKTVFLISEPATDVEGDSERIVYLREFTEDGKIGPVKAMPNSEFTYNYEQVDPENAKLNKLNLFRKTQDEETGRDIEAISGLNPATWGRGERVRVRIGSEYHKGIIEEVANEDGNFIIQLPDGRTVSAKAEDMEIINEEDQPEAVEPEAVEPEAVEPEAVEPDPVEPEAVEPDPVEPDPVGPEPVGPEPVGPEPVLPPTEAEPEVEPVTPPTEAEPEVEPVTPPTEAEPEAEPVTPPTEAEPEVEPVTPPTEAEPEAEPVTPPTEAEPEADPVTPPTEAEPVPNPDSNPVTQLDTKNYDYEFEAKGKSWAVYRVGKPYPIRDEKPVAQFASRLEMFDYLKAAGLTSINGSNIDVLIEDEKRKTNKGAEGFDIKEAKNKYPRIEYALTSVVDQIPYSYSKTNESTKVYNQRNELLFRVNNEHATDLWNLLTEKGYTQLKEHGTENNADLSTLLADSKLNDNIRANREINKKHPDVSFPEYYNISEKNIAIVYKPTHGYAAEDTDNAMSKVLGSSDDISALAAWLKDRGVNEVTYEGKKVNVSDLTNESPKPSWGSGNTVHSLTDYAEKSEKLKEQLKAKRTLLNTEFRDNGLWVAGFHIEAGAKSFMDYATRMVEEFGSENFESYKLFYSRYAQLNANTKAVEGMNTMDDYLYLHFEDFEKQKNQQNVITEGDNNNNKQPNTEENGNATISTKPVVTNTPDTTEPKQPNGVSGDDQNGKSGKNNDPALEGNKLGVGSDRGTDETGNGSNGSTGVGVGPTATDVSTNDGKNSNNTGQGVNTTGENGKNNTEARAKNGNNHRIDKESRTAYRTFSLRLDDNIKAVKIINTLEAEQREATPEEREALAKYVGWGGMSEVFQERNRNHDWVKRALGPYWESARRSTTTSFYTPVNIVEGIWRMVERLYQQNPNMPRTLIEPSAGVGDFLGLMPQGVASVFDIQAVEKDELSGLILKHLYPDAHVEIRGFEKRSPVNVGLAVGNVPFISVRPERDNSFPKLSQSFNVHDFIIAKAIAMMKSDGLAVFITSTSSIDNPQLIKYLKDNNAAIIGAFRLNNQTFAGNANTEASSDILVIQKIGNGFEFDGELPNVDKKVSLREVNITELEKKPSKADQANNKIASVRVNEYFSQHPEYIGGTIRLGIETGDVIRKTMVVCENDPKIDQNKQMDKFFDEINLIKTKQNKKEDGPEKTNNKPKTNKADKNFKGSNVVVDSNFGKDNKVVTTDKKNDLLAQIRAKRNNLNVGIDPELFGMYVQVATYYVEGGIRSFGRASKILVKELGTEIKPYLIDIYEAVKKELDPNTVEMMDDVASYTLDDVNAILSTKDLMYTSESNIELGQTYFEDAGIKEGGYFVHKDGKLYVRRGDWAEAIGFPESRYNKYVATALAYLDIRDARDELLNAEYNNSPDIEKIRKKLNTVYDSFRDKFGNLNSNSMTSFLKAEVDYSNVAALEIETRTNDWVKTDIFTTRQVHAEKEMKAETIEDALVLSQYQKGFVDLGYIAEMLNRDVNEVENEMKEKSLIFFDPVLGEYVDSNLYLSGNVRAKIEEAKQAGLLDNVVALTKVLPADIKIENIYTSLGSTWIPESVYQSFVYYKTGIVVDVRKNIDGGLQLGDWNKNGSETAQILEMIDNSLRNKNKVIYATDEEGTKTIDKAATAEYQQKQDNIKLEFEDWIHNQENLSEELEKIYNDKYNSFVKVHINMGNIEYFPNMTRDKKPYPHQLQAVELAKRFPMLLAHEVGSGKTLSLICSAMEMKRLGIAKKPCIVVQRATYTQFVGEIRSLYPNAKILAPASESMTRSEREKFLSQIAYNDWDIVVLYHDYLNSIPDDTERRRQYIENAINEAEQFLQWAELNGDRETVNDIKKRIRELSGDLDGLNSETEDIQIFGNDIQPKKRSVKGDVKAGDKAGSKTDELTTRKTDNVATFEQTGIDALLVDESHQYKRLGFMSNFKHVKGIDKAASKRAQSLRMKTQWILENNNGKNVVFATGTPISNTMAEIWTILRYLMTEQQMKDLDIFYFDQFVQNFGRITDSAEFTTSGKYKSTKRFSTFENLPELLSIWNMVSNTVLSKNVSGLQQGKGGIPFLSNSNKEEDVILDQSDVQKAVMALIRQRLEKHEQRADKKKDKSIPVVMFGKSKQLAIDPRLIDSTLPEGSDSKTSKTVEIVYDDLMATKDYKGTVAIFSDLLRSRDKKFDLFNEIKRKLVEKGIPEDQIAIISDYNTDKKKADLYKKVNSGDVRVVMGSTEKLGVGVNIQERLHLLIHMDIPNRPSDYQQRNGRILRKGNKHAEWGKEVRILRIGTRGTLDATGYQRMDIKSAFVRAIMEGKTADRILEEIDTEDDVNDTGFKGMMSMLSGSDAAIKLIVEEKKNKRLLLQRDNFEKEQKRARIFIDSKDRLFNDIKDDIEATKKLANALAIYKDQSEVQSVEINGKTFNNIDSFITWAQKNGQKELVDSVADELRNETDKSIKSKEKKYDIKVNGFDVKVKIVADWAKTQDGKFYIKRSIYITEPSGFLKDQYVGAKLEAIVDRNKGMGTVLSGDQTAIANNNLKMQELRLDQFRKQLKGFEEIFGKEWPKADELKQNSEKITQLKIDIEADMEKINQDSMDSGVANVDFSGTHIYEIIFGEIEEETQEEENTEDDEEFYRFVGESGMANARNQTHTQYLDEAKKMEKSGSDASTIKRATGWERGHDDKWRYEYSDVEGQYLRFMLNEYEDEFKKGQVLRGEDLLSGELLEMYPYFRNMEITIIVDAIQPNSGVHNANKNTIDITAMSKSKAASIFVHELQHAIQAQERFAEGGDLEVGTQTLLDHTTLIEATSEIHNSLADYYNTIIHPLARYASNPTDQNWDNLTDEQKDVYNRLGGEQAVFAELLALSNTVNKLSKSVTSLNKKRYKLTTDRKSAMENYKRIAGETEARNVSDRMKLTDEQRRNSLAEETSEFKKGETFVFTFDDRRKLMANHAVKLGKKLGIQVEISKEESNLKDGAKGKFNAKTGVITIYVNNILSESDLQRTILHEALGHKSMRDMFGDKWKGFLNDFWESLPEKERKKLLEEQRKRGYKAGNLLAMEEYIARMAENYEEPKIWAKIKGAFRNFLRKAGLNVDWTDADIRYLLYKAGKLSGITSVIQQIKSVGDLARFEKEFNLEQEKWRNEQPTEDQMSEDYLYSLPDLSEEEARKLMNPLAAPVHRVKLSEKARKDLGFRTSLNDHLNWYARGVRGKKLYQDKWASLKSYQDIVLRERGETIGWYEDAYAFSTRVPAINSFEHEEFMKTIHRPMVAAAKEFMKFTGYDYAHLQAYVMAKHAIERNKYTADKLAAEFKEKMRQQINRDRSKLLEQATRIREEEGDEAFQTFYSTIEPVITANKKVYDAMYDEYNEKIHQKDFAGLTGLMNNKLLEKYRKEQDEIQLSDITEWAEEFIDDSEGSAGEKATGRLWETIREVNHFSIRKLFDSGMITADFYQGMLSQYEYYVPLRGWDETTIEDLYVYYNDKLSKNVVNPIKKMHGRRSMADDPFLYMLQMAQSSIMIANKNVFKRRFLRFVRNHPTTAIFERKVWFMYNEAKKSYEEVTLETTPDMTGEEYEEAEREFEQRMNELSAETIEDEEGNVIELATRRPKRASMPVKIIPLAAKEHEITVNEFGEKRILFIAGNPEIAQDFMNKNDVRSNTGMWAEFLNKIQWMTNQMAQNFTSRNPAFVARNMARDMQAALTGIFIDKDAKFMGRFLKSYPEAMAGMKRYIRQQTKDNNEVDRYVMEFLRNGGETGYSQIFALEQTRSKLKKEFDDISRTQNMQNWAGDKISAFSNLFVSMNRIAEDATRLAVYIASRRGGSDIDSAISDAKEMTLNFNRSGGGTVFNALRIMYIFINPAIQSMQRQYSLLKKHPAKAISSYMMWATMGFMNAMLADLAIAYGFAGGGDDERKKRKEQGTLNSYSILSDFMRGTSFFVPIGESVVTIPLAQEYRAWKMLGDLIYQGINGHVKPADVAVQTLQMGMEATAFSALNWQESYINGDFGLAGLIMPTFGLPIYQAENNVDFMGRPIYKQNFYDEYVPKHKLAFKSTPEWLVETSKYLNTATGGDDVKRGKISANPAYWNYLVTQYLGGPYQVVSQSSRLIDAAYTWVSNGFTSPKGEQLVEWRDIPVLSGFVREQSNTYRRKVNENFFKAKDQYKELMYLLNGYKKETIKGDTTAYQKAVNIISENGQLLILMNGAEKTLNQISKRKSYLNEDSTEILNKLDSIEFVVKEEFIKLMNNIDVNKLKDESRK